MSHHYSGPNATFPGGDARLDYADLFVFPRPGDAGKSVLIMDVHPSVGIHPPGPTTAEPFAPDALYEIRIDTNDDDVADITYQASFKRMGGAMTASLRRIDGAGASTTNADGHVIVEDAPVSMDAHARVMVAGDYRFFAGWRSDPFFFDAGALNNFQWVGHDIFGDRDICSIVVEVPDAALGSRKVQLWARVLVRRNGSWVQIERGAKPSQTPFLTGEQNELYRASEPAGDSRFIPTFAHSIEHLGGLTPEDATRVASTLLPDVLKYDSSRPARYPENGRAFSDDAADVFVSTVTNGKITGDGIGPHADFLPEFPFLGPPHDRSRRIEALKLAISDPISAD